MWFTIYLIGYGNQTAEPLLERLAQAGQHVLVIDVRARRRSWAWTYCAPQVEYIFKKAGHDYLWLPELGGNGHEADTGWLFGMQALEVQVRRGLPVVLLCAERSSSECHRSEVARLLQVRLAKAGDHLEIRPL